MRGRYAGAIDSGPSGSSSQRGALRRMPGEASGMMSVKAKAPALPRLASAATPVRSITVTWRPSCCRRNAMAMPTLPAPITSTSQAKSAAASGGSGRSSAVDIVFEVGALKAPT